MSPNKQVQFRFLYLFLLPLFVMVSSVESQESLPSHSKQSTGSDQNMLVWLDSIRKVYAPDGRVALLDIHFDNQGASKVIKGETNVQKAYDVLQKKISELGYQDSLTLLPMGKFTSYPYGLINISTANIRAESRHSSELSTQAILGTPIKVYKQNGGWYFVQTPDGYLGWLNEGAFTSLSSNDFKEYISMPKVVFIGDMGRIYRQANTRSKYISDLTMGNILIELEQNTGFTKVKMPDGRVGYIESDHLIAWTDFNLETSTRERILATAHKLIGRPYLWGGTSSKAMDCSGFTKTVFFANRMILPRDASQQVLTGDLITTDINELDKVQPGDLLFFGRIQGEKEKVTHVGIYLGDSRMIHAGDGLVQIQSLNPVHSDYVEKRRTSFLRAKNMLAKAGKNGVHWVNKSPWYN